MYEYISGVIIQANPAYTVIENNGIGYNLQISLQTFSKLKSGEKATLYIHEIIREDFHGLFGFFTEDERIYFRLLLGVSGVGGNTARMVLSTLSADELRVAIATENAEAIKNVKGIGIKTAQRIIIELKDKIDKHSVSSELFTFSNNTSKQEALSALITLGFVRQNAEKAIEKVLLANKEAKVEDIIKSCLNIL